MFNRIIPIKKTKSFFLFGARGTGKSTLIRELFLLNAKKDQILTLNLLEAKVEDRYSRDPDLLLRDIQARVRQGMQPEWVFIDEVQKIPKLLDLVHLCIEEYHQKFILTGSSARKLKRGGANLLAGRATAFSLFPLTHLELGDQFNLTHALHYGTLPEIYHCADNEEKRDYLETYALTYLKEEIQLEQIVRKLDPFRRFLEVAAQLNGEILNFKKIGMQIGVSTDTVISYFQILEDTLIGFLLPGFDSSIRKQLTLAPKFYFFDPGVKRALDFTITSELSPSTYGFGKAFEHWVILEIMRLNNYFKKGYRLSYLRTKNQVEVDVVLEKPSMQKSHILIEIKSTKQVLSGDVKQIAAIAKDLKKSEAYCFSLDQQIQQIEGVLCLPWDKGIQRIFSEAIK